ncbi:MAG: glycosyltransferase family 4 protein [Anaerolineaceae bacterium]|nr:glycosyltransferase family 4 protein [Anaerolineaceae bacterium]
MTERIRVAMLGPYPFDPSRISGGVQAAYTYLLKGLVQSDQLDVNVITFSSIVYRGPERFKKHNLTVHLLPAYPRYERLRNYQTYQTMINKILDQIQPDLIHAQDAGSDAHVAIRSGIPTVVTVHGIRWEDGKHYSSVNQRLHSYFDSMLTERYVMRHTRHLIAISHYVPDYFKGILNPDVEVYFVPNAIDERFFNLPQSLNEQVILFAGRVIPRKRVMDLVQAFAQVLRRAPSAHLHIAGEISSEPAYVESIRRWVHRSQLDRHIHFLGLLSEESILKEFAGCGMLVLPSAQETAPMVIAQAMAASKPVVASRVGGIEEMVGDNASRGILVDVGDIDGLAAAILRLLEHTDLQATMGRNGREFAMENYHLEGVAQRTIEVYRCIACEEQKAIA